MSEDGRRAQAARLEAISALVPAFRERARASDDASTFPTENFADLRAADLLALTAPVGLGGQGLWSEGAFVPYYEVLEALAYADTSTAQLVQVHSHALGFLARHGTPEQHERYLRPIVAAGQTVASVGSETAPRATTPGVYSSELIADGDGWIVTCTKQRTPVARREPVTAKQRTRNPVLKPLTGPPPGCPSRSAKRPRCCPGAGRPGLGVRGRRLAASGRPPSRLDHWGASPRPSSPANLARRLPCR